MVDSRWSVSRYSVDTAMSYRSIFRRRTSTVYQSYVGGISVNCQWHIGQLSVDYQSWVNLAGESNGFPFERLSNGIMLLGKMLQCEAWLLYEANRRALRTMGMVIYSFSNLNLWLPWSYSRRIVTERRVKRLLPQSQSARMMNRKGSSWHALMAHLQLGGRPFVCFCLFFCLFFFYGNSHCLL